MSNPTKPRRKRQPYRYQFHEGGRVVTTWRKIYRTKDGVWVHRHRDGLLSLVSPNLATQLFLAEIPPQEGGAS